MQVIKDLELHASLYREFAPRIVSGPWHWFAYHFRHVPTHPFVASILEAAADCERGLPTLGRSLLHDLVAISGLEKHLPHWEMLNQKLAEILVLGRIMGLPWDGGGVEFQHEPEGNPGGKRPEMLVKNGADQYLFEVKAPNILQHQIDRGSNDTQIPGRFFDPSMARDIAGGGAYTRPRDNPLKDFLLNADAKFAPFKSRGLVRTALVVVWDDFIYEPITSLISAGAQGLLTEQSFARDSAGEALRFPNVDVVIIVRHLMYFIQAARERSLIDRSHAFDFGDDNGLPNVLVPVPGGQAMPDFVIDGFRALHHQNEVLQRMAEYRSPEVIMWTNI